MGALTFIKENQNVRIKLGDSVYLAQAVKVIDAELMQLFASGRTIYQLIPRTLKLDESP